jgi:hypothetical protein
MSVIFLTLCALALGGLLIGFLSSREAAKQCQAVSGQKGAVYNVCILAKSHNGSHVAADGMWF